MAILLLQRMLITAGPIIFLVTELPQVAYVVKVCTVLIVCTVVLSFIFIPKKMCLARFGTPYKGAQVVESRKSGS
jgi:hypothetical protein